MKNNKNKPLILMYHAVVNNPQDHPPAREEGASLYDLPRERFYQQMRFLHERGVKTAKIEEHASLKRNQIILTFDDGEMNNYTQALPILSAFGFQAYFFIIVERVGRPGYMGFREIKKMFQGGMTIGSHSLSHSILTQLAPEELRRELVDSKKNLEELIGYPVNHLSIPRGFYNQQVLEEAFGAGYKTVFVSRPHFPLGENCYPRLDVKGDWTLNRFRAALEGKTPLWQMVADRLKDTLKVCLGETKYNQLRGVLLRK